MEQDGVFASGAIAPSILKLLTAVTYMKDEALTRPDGTKPVRRFSIVASL